jgi:mono/diheme cytochrome c family protein
MIGKGTAMAMALALLAAGHAEAQETRGRYLVDHLAACGNCHTPRGQDGKYLAGGEHIKHEDFDAVSSNITPDDETGIGKWTDDQIVRAIRDGLRPDGSLIGPAMPSVQYRELADEDVWAIVAYLRTVPAVHNLVTEKSKYDFALPASWGPPVGHVTAPPPEERVAYGAYLAGPVGRCMICHTEHAANSPVGGGGVPFYGPWGVSVSANITPEGIGDWTDAEVERAIRTGVAKDGRKLLPPMPFAIYEGIKPGDMTAIIAYLRSLPGSKPTGE